MTTMPKILVVVHDIDDNLNEMANPIAEAGILMDTWDVQNDSVGRPDLEKLEQYSGIISLGAHAGVLEEEKHPWMSHERKIMQWALATETPLLGLCFGSQLLASAAGSRVYKAENGEFAWTKVDMLPEASSDPVIGALGDTADAFQFHYDRKTQFCWAKATAQSKLSELVQALGQLSFIPKSAFRSSWHG